MQYKIVAKELLSKLSEADKITFEDCINKFESIGFSLIVGTAIKRELTNISDIAMVNGTQGVVDRKYYVITIAIEMKTISQHQVKEDSPKEVIEYLEGFLKDYNINVTL